MFDIEVAPVGRGPRQGAPDRAAPRYGALKRFGQPVKEWRQEMLLDWKPAIGRLHPETAAHARHLAREAPLAGGIADVLDHGIAEYYVEGPIAKRQRAGVSGHPLGGARQVGAGPRHVQQDQPRLHGSELPIVGRAADIEDARIGADRKLPHKALHAAAAEAPREPSQRGEWRRHSYIL